MSILKEKLSPLAPYAMVPVRLLLFATFFHRGTQKLFGLFDGPGLAGCADYYAAVGIPLASVVAFLVGVLETVGSISFLVGAGVRLFSLLISTLMVTSIVMSFAGTGFHLTAAAVEYRLALVAMCMALLFGGPGWASIEWADEEGVAPQAVS